MITQNQGFAGGSWDNDDTEFSAGFV